MLGGRLSLRVLMVAASLAGSLAAAPAFAAKIAIIGTGNVAGALGPEFAAQGHTIVYGSRTPTEADVAALVQRTGRGATATTQRESIVGADIVVLAVPGTAAEQVTRDLGDLSGKIIIDPTNRIRRGSPDGYMDADLPGGKSNAELIQAAAPNARVVKAFNTLNIAQMTDPETAGGPITIAIAGDNVEAKAVVAELIKGMGLETVDFGPLRFAGTLEEMLVIWANARQRNASFNYYMRPMPATR